MLRSPASPKALWIAWIACALVGGAAAWLVILGNPRNMGICGACFLREHPHITTEQLGERWAKGAELWRHGAVGREDAASGCWRICCERPERTRAGESTAYWTKLRPLACECGDWTRRRVPCKHIVALWLHVRLGAAPVPGQRAA